MAIKPTADPEVWAFQDIYSSGPKSGQITKSISSTVLALQGHIPGVDFPTASDEFNSWLRKVGDLASYTFLSSDTADETKHIVDTNNLGQINAVSAIFGGTGAVLTSLIVRSNIAGDCVLVEPTNQVGIKIEPLVMTTPRNQLEIITDSNFSSSIAMILCRETVGPGGAGSQSGIQCEVNTNNSYGGLAVQGARLAAAVNAYNGIGPAGEFRSNDGTVGCETLQAVNLATIGTSGKFGFAEDESLSANIGGAGIRSKGGPGEFPTANGGTGVFGLGGRAKAGGAVAGTGIWGIGGDDPTNEGSLPAVVASSNSLTGGAFKAEHFLPAATAQLAEFNTGENIAPGVLIDCEGFGIGLRVKAEGNTGVSIEMIPEGGAAVIQPALELVPQVEPLGINVNPGHLWSIADGTYPNTINIHFGVESNTSTFLQKVLTPSFYARGSMHTVVVLSASPGTTVLDASFGFAGQMCPIDAQVAKVSIHGVIQWQGGATVASCIIRIFDITAADNIFVQQYTYETLASATTVSVSTSILHTFTTGGARTFRFEIDNSDVSTATFTGFVEIENIKGL